MFFNKFAGDHNNNMTSFLKNIPRRVAGYFSSLRDDRGRLAGLLGALIIHLIIGIIFMLFKIGSLKKAEDTEIITVEFEEIEMTENEEELITLPVTSIEKILQGDNEMLNIARNLSSKSEQTINRQDYIDMVKEELIKNGQLGEDNFIDEQKKMPETGDEKLAMEQEKPKTSKEDKQKESQEMANYKGPTRIYYDLGGRNHLYLPIPIYLCEGSGKVALSIYVNQKGVVEEAKVISGESTTNDPCLVETAVSTALISKFAPDMNAPKTQRGTLTYHFVAQ